MTLKILIILCLISLVRTQDDAKSGDVPYSSIFTSFGSHIESKEKNEQTSELSATNEPAADVKLIQSAPAPDTKPIQSAPIYETGVEGSNNGAQASSANANQHSILYSIPNVQSFETSSSESVTNEAKIILAPIATPIAKKISSNPVFSPAFVGKDRLITPGLSAFATSGEKYEGGSAKITIINPEPAKTSPSVFKSTNSISAPQSESSEPIESDLPKESAASDFQTSDSDTESHSSFDGFGTSYSW